MKKKILVDVKIECESPYFYCVRDQEDYAKRCEQWVKDFHDFLRDHRSQDPVNLSVERIFEEQCEFCGYEWDVDETGCPSCCDEAIEEFMKAKEVAAA